MSPKRKKTSRKKTKITKKIPIVAHQLKTPITVIKGYLEALLSGDCGKTTLLQRDYLNDIAENIERISVFIETLLDVERIEAKRFDIELEPVALEKITKQVLDALSHWIEANNCEIVFKEPEELPEVLTNVLRVRQVIQNFIANAVVYKEGRRKVEITIEQKGKNVVFACKDNGIAVPEGELNKVFSEFYRSEKAMELDPSGSGLGLFISKAVIKSSGGKIWCKKNKTKGMTFYFSLPIVKT